MARIPQVGEEAQDFGRIKGSSHQLEHRVAWDCQVRNGRVARVDPYFSWEEGLEAVGLAEFR
jgi:hypothetical protein